MAAWQTVTGSYAAPNGLVVTPVGTSEDLAGLGKAFRNGLMIPRQRAIWADMCKKGSRQICKVDDEQGNLVANAEISVRGGRARVLFVRGHGNAEFGPGTPQGDAVAAFAAELNAAEPTLERAMAMSANGFVASAAPADEKEGTWERAIRLAAEHNTSPFAALVQGVGGEGAPEVGYDEAEPFIDSAWTPLSAPWTSPAGVTVEPVGTRAGLRQIGYELENNLFAPEATSGMAELCSAGRVQVCAIYADGGLEAYAEIKPFDGELRTLACRGHSDDAASPAALEALAGYLAAANARAIPLNIEPENGSFGPYNEDLMIMGVDFGDFGEHPVLPLASRSGFVEELGLDLADIDDGSEPIRWEGLTEPYAFRGMIVEPLTDQDALRSTGAFFENALQAMHRMWAENCAKGTMQMVRVVGADGTALSNAELQVVNGEVEASFNLGHGNAPASALADAALRAYVDAVNGRTVDLKIQIGEDGFSFEAPAPRPGM